MPPESSWSFLPTFNASIGKMHRIELNSSYTALQNFSQRIEGGQGASEIPGSLKAQERLLCNIPMSKLRPVLLMKSASDRW